MNNMDEVLKQNDSFSKSQPPKCLFPIATHSITNTDATNQGRTLFPCVGSLQQENKNDATLDWLTNQSFQVTDKDETKQSVYISDDNHTQDREDNSSSSQSDEKEHQKKHKKHRKRRRDNSESSDESQQRSKHRKKVKKKKKKKHKRKETFPIVPDKVKPDTIWIEDTGLSPEQAYREHREKDVQNLMYGSIYRLDVATYKIKPNTACLGLQKNQSLVLNESKKKKNKRTKDVDYRYWNNTSLFSEIPKPLLPSKSSKSEVFVGNVENFAYIPIDLPSSRDEDDNDEENADGNLDPTDRAISQQTAKLNKILRDNPHDIKTWIQLAKFQGNIVNREDFTRASTTMTGNETTKKHSRIINEKQISVIEKALEQNPSSIELIIYHLDLCKDVWENDKLIERWNKVVFTYPNKASLWRKYLLFLQSRVSIFTFRKAQKAYERCFSMLSSIKDGTFVSHQAEDGIEDNMLGLFVQYCKFLKQAGHIERCVASLQAMIELNCLCPDDLGNSTTLAGKIEFLETFWDSGQPRFGESGAVGWKTWMNKATTAKSPVALETLDCKKIFKSSYTVNESDDIESSEEQMVKGRPKWKAWLNVEVNRDQVQLMPWQPDQTKGETEDDCEDPERIVLFDDIKLCLFMLKDPQNKLKLVLSFLEILGVTLSPSSSSNSHGALQYFELSIESLEQILSSLNCDMSNVGWLRLGYWYTAEEVNTKPLLDTLQLVRNIFVQSLAIFEGDTKNCLMRTWLYYEFYLGQLETGKARKQKLKEVYKLAKAILKEPSNRNNFQIWEVFAKITSLSGDVSESRHVYDSTLTMASQLQENNGDRMAALSALYRSYAEMELKQLLVTPTPSHSTDQDRLLHILVSLVENNRYEPLSETVQTSGVSPARILRARRTYTQMCEDSIQELNEPRSHDESRVHWGVHCIVCCALFAYVTSGISSAVAVYEKVLSSLSSTVDDFYHELVWTNYITLLKMHKKKETMPLRNMKQVIHRALESFPNNPMFLDCYLQVELKSNLTGELRRFFDHLTHNATSLLPWIFAINYEDLRSSAMLTARDCRDVLSSLQDGQKVGVVTSLPTTGISHRQRALFDRATSSVTGRQCIVLWRMYIQFELGQGNWEQAKAVFYQALQNCAWAKSLYLDSIKAFPDDIQSTLDMMEEKELRLRTPLEEIDILIAE